MWSNCYLATNVNKFLSSTRHGILKLTFRSRAQNIEDLPDGNSESFPAWLINFEIASTPYRKNSMQTMIMSGRMTNREHWRGLSCVLAIIQTNTSEE